MEYTELANHQRLLDVADSQQSAATAGNRIINDSQFRNGSLAVPSPSKKRRTASLQIAELYLSTCPAPHRWSYAQPGTAP